ncbi:MAG: CbiX/SirB N-terminal domain-containing protein [Eubacteriales bacterium]|nr:CbiX/SirB N-terminal domain-containing protein [Eubacteriales bacterium]
MAATILLIHGSKNDQTAQQANSLRDRLRKIPALSAKRLEIAYLHFAQPDLRTVIKSLYHDGIHQIQIIPLFTFAGNHTMQDIPGICAEMNAQHPHLEFSIGQPLASQPGFVDLISQMLLEAHEGSLLS